MSRHARYGRAAQSRHVSPAEWSGVLDQAQRLARAAEDLSGAVQAPGDLVQFRVRVTDIGAESFPAPSDHARAVAGAFLNAARAFAHALTDPEARTACAPLLREAARYADQLLVRHQTLLAQSTWGRQFGDDR